MAVTEAQARRALRRAEFPWSPLVKDPRKAHNQRHEHHGLLSVLAAAFACGRTCLRRVEEFSADLSKGARSALGVGRAVSDTTLFRLLSKQGVLGLRETVWAQMRAAFRSKVVRNDLFPFGVLTVDGKSLWASTSSHVEGAKTTIDPASGVMTAALLSVRAVLTSSRVRPCLDVEVIGEKAGEAPAFRRLFPRVNDEFGEAFRIVTTDAGLTCRENAALVEAAGKHYLFALRENQKSLHALAVSKLAATPVTERTEEHRNGARILRELRTVAVSAAPEMTFPGLQQVWSVRRQVTLNGATAPASDEVRYFLSSIPPTLLSPGHQLDLVRLHWGIENNHNWTMDVALAEDDIQPCQLSREAIEVVGWLRILGYNLLSAWRAQAPSQDKQPLSWLRCMELLRDAFLMHNQETINATIA
jgi:Transposase DDE domain